MPVAKKHYLVPKQSFSHSGLEVTIADGASVVRQRQWDVVLSDNTAAWACCTAAVVSTALWVAADSEVLAAAHKIPASATAKRKHLLDTKPIRDHSSSSTEH